MLLRTTLLGALALALLIAAPARAAEVSLSGAAVTVAAAPGEANRLTLTLAPGQLVVADTGAPVVAGQGCVPAGTGRVTCAASTLTGAFVELGDGDDTLAVSGALALVVGDGAGDDAVTGGSADDVFAASPGADSYTGGGGIDTIDFSSRTAPVVSDSDGVADDGAAGELDNVRADVERVLGGSGDDRLTGGTGSDRLVGGPGADRLDGAAADDQLDGGAGDDELLGGSGADTADYGARSAAVAVDLTARTAGAAGEHDALTSVENATTGSGDDRLTGDAAANRLQGGAGADVLDGRAGGDTLEGGDGVDTVDYSARTRNLFVDLDGNADDGESGERDNVRPGAERLLGGAADDTLTGADAAETLAGGGGRDALDGNGGDDVLAGGTGDDQAWGDGGADRLDGAAGNDKLEGGEGDDALAGGDGNDSLYGNDGADALDGADGADRLFGGAGDEALAGGEGNDELYGNDGADALAGAGGNDKLDGGAGNDALDGGDGGDRLYGSYGADSGDGGPGNDQLYGGDGDDSLAGGDGIDRLGGDDGNDRVDGGAGDDDVSGGDGDDGVLGAAGADRLGGGEGNDQLDGAEDDDSLRGDGGADRLLGGDGNDGVSGGDDDDVLIGGAGADELWGDDGHDTADYATRTAPLSIDNDDQADDGEAGEGDNVHSSVEAVIGGAGNDKLTGSGSDDDLFGENGDDELRGARGRDELAGGAGADRIWGGEDLDVMDGGDGRDRIDARDGVGEPLRCGAGKDRALADRSDRPEQCDEVTNAKGGGPAAPNVVRPQRPAKRVTGVRRRTGGGRFVPIPGFPGESIDRRLLPDIAYLVRKYRIHITDGYASAGHADGGEHPRGLAVDIVPGAGGSWNDIDRLAKWAEPRQNRPRAPFRWVGYNGDYNHGRGNHLHLSWSHSPTSRGKPARVVYTLALRAKPRARVTRLAHLGGTSNPRLGRKPSVRTGLASPSRCSGTAQLRPIWKAAARSFGLRWSVLASITEVESGFGCNMGPSTAGAIGWTQFMPATWRMWGMDASGDGKADPYDGVDAIYSTARYLRASGAPAHYRRALYAYNHAWWYVNKVLRGAKKYR